MDLAPPSDHGAVTVIGASRLEQLTVAARRPRAIPAAEHPGRDAPITSSCSSRRNSPCRAPPEDRDGARLARPAVELPGRLTTFRAGPPPRGRAAAFIV